MDHRGGVQGREVTSGFRLDVSVVHFHVDYLHEFYLGGQFLDFFLQITSIFFFIGRNQEGRGRGNPSSRKNFKNLEEKKVKKDV